MANGMCVSGAHVKNINEEVISILKMLSNEQDKTSEVYMILSQRLNDMLEALDTATNLMITRFEYEIAEKKWENEWFNNKRVIGFTNSN